MSDLVEVIQRAMEAVRAGDARAAEGWLAEALASARGVAARSLPPWIGGQDDADGVDDDAGRADRAWWGDEPPARHELPPPRRGGAA